MTATEEPRFRPEQAAIIRGYRKGRLGIAAVPGSGKTFTLSHLAARLVAELASQGLTQGVDRKEILVVTFTNSAVNSFRSRIAAILQWERGLLPYIGYRVRTLHSLAHDIVRERPSLAGLAEDFQILDERVSNQIVADIARNVLGQYQEIFSDYLRDDLSEPQSRRLLRETLPDLAASLGLQFIRHAKNHLLDAASLREIAAEHNAPLLPLAQFGLAVYEDYQRSLSYRGAVDFDDLIRLAIVTLQEDEHYCQRLQAKWPFILEDEAQDSSHLQETMLRLLSANRNWVRVGDPNQAIYTTFTTANPHFLRRFLEQSTSQQLTTSGRSAQPIIDLANEMVRWTTREHPLPPLRSAFLPQYIQPVEPDDPNPNPPAEPNSLYIHAKPGQNVTPETELELVAANIQRFLASNTEYTVAALVPENSRGVKLSEVLKQLGIPHVDLLRSTSETRAVAARLRHTLAFLCNPHQARLLAQLYLHAWSGSASDHAEFDAERAALIGKVLSSCREIERFLWPRAGDDWLQEVELLQQEPALMDILQAFREDLRLWTQAASLPVDQLILTLAQYLFQEPADIALAYKIAVVMRGIAQNNPEWRLPDFLGELNAISENQRKFVGFDDVEAGYEPQPGTVTIATMHAAKGLEWDRVYLLGVSNYGFPSAQVYDNYLAERWFIRDELNLEAELLAQIEALVSADFRYVEGQASTQARLDYAAERLRLLYVGITRAKRNLMITWNMGRYWQKGGDSQNRPALPLTVLWSYTQEGRDT